jgi:peptide-methionine (S)-S-oxide reductase
MIRYTMVLTLFMSIVVLSCSNGQKPGQSSDVQKISDYVAGKGYEKYAVATFAGGCFWCTEASFERIEGVVDVISGYSGGEKTYPTYKEVSYGRTDHAEAIQIFYDPAMISFDKLLEIFFVAHDPTTLNRQGPDVGPQYRSEIFYHDQEQKEKSEAYMKKLDASEKFKNPIVTKLSQYKEFWTAEGYHQDYYEHNPQNPYIQKVSRPKVEKVVKTFSSILKEKYKK